MTQRGQLHANIFVDIITTSYLIAVPNTANVCND